MVNNPEAITPKQQAVIIALEAYKVAPDKKAKAVAADEVKDAVGQLPKEDKMFATIIIAMLGQ